MPSLMLRLDDKIGKMYRNNHFKKKDYCSKLMKIYGKLQQDDANGLTTDI